MYLLIWGYTVGLYWALSPRFVSDLSVEVQGQAKGQGSENYML